MRTSRVPDSEDLGAGPEEITFLTNSRWCWCSWSRGPHFENCDLRPSEIIHASHSVNILPCWMRVILVWRAWFVWAMARHHRSTPPSSAPRAPECYVVLDLHSYVTSQNCLFLCWTGQKKRGKREWVDRSKETAFSWPQQRWLWEKQKSVITANL